MSADTGDVVAEAKKNNTHFFILSKKIVERLGVKSVPSVIEQVKKRFKIREIYVEE